MRVIAIISLLLLAGCYDPERDRYYYTRADVDAINAQIACRNLARNVLQIERCVVRR
jgi:uncharacterized lipoprotein YmbA